MFIDRWLEDFSSAKSREVEETTVLCNFCTLERKFEDRDRSRVSEIVKLEKLVAELTPEVASLIGVASGLAKEESKTDDVEKHLPEPMAHVDRATSANEELEVPRKEDKKAARKEPDECKVDKNEDKETSAAKVKRKQGSSEKANTEDGKKQEKKNNVRKKNKKERKKEEESGKGQSKETVRKERKQVGEKIHVVGDSQTKRIKPMMLDARLRRNISVTTLPGHRNNRI